jgi:rhamnose utilization protein RhaD (predicted bifunctional aldolase and dehydrogenase)
MTWRQLSGFWITVGTMTYAAGLDEPGKLLYRSNLLGADKRITNYGGGNTSAKVMETDPLTGEKVKVLWVKGSGGDVGTIKLDGFATLYRTSWIR